VEAVEIEPPRDFNRLERQVDCLSPPRRALPVAAETALSEVGRPKVVMARRSRAGLSSVKAPSGFEPLYEALQASA
jgi:hypothetical protein